MSYRSFYDEKNIDTSKVPQKSFRGVKDLRNKIIMWNSNTIRTRKQKTDFDVPSGRLIPRAKLTLGNSGDISRLSASYRGKLQTSLNARKSGLSKFSITDRNFTSSAPLIASLKNNAMESSAVSKNNSKMKDALKKLQISKKNGSARDQVLSSSSVLYSKQERLPKRDQKKSGIISALTRSSPGEIAGRFLISVTPKANCVKQNRIKIGATKSPQQDKSQLCNNAK